MGVRAKQSPKVHETINEKEDIMANDNTNETTGTGINWGKIALRDTHGSVDKPATLALIDEELTAHIADNEVDMDEIETACETVFEKLRATGGVVAQKAMMDLNELSHRALDLLDNVPYGASTRLQERIKDFVRGESETFVKTDGAEGKYHIKRGKDGGVRLNTPAYLDEYRKLQAAKRAKEAAAAK